MTDPVGALVRPTSVAGILDADRMVVERLFPLAHRHGLTIEMFRAASLMSEQDGCTVGDIARRIAATPSSTTRLVDRLVQENLAYRRQDAVDRRRILIRLSDTGIELWDRLVADLESTNGE